MNEIRWELIRPLMVGDKVYYTDENGNKFNAFVEDLRENGTATVTLAKFGVVLDVEKKWLSRGWWKE